RAAGEVKGNSTALQVFQNSARTGHKKIIGVQRGVAQAGDTAGNAMVQSSQVFAFVPKRFARLSATFPDALRELNHLVNRLFSVLAHDVVVEQLPDVCFSL